MKRDLKPALWAIALCLAPLAIPTASGQETKEIVIVDDISREFTVRLPRAYDAKQHYPVVILLHGMNQDPSDIERLTRFNELADKDSIIAVYPAAMHGRWNVGVHPPERRPMMQPRRRYGYPGGGYPGGGYPGGGYPGGGRPPRRDPQQRQERPPAPADDIAFFGQMLDQLQQKFSVDSSRIYAVGLSDGGFMSQKLGCALSDRFAAVGAVGATMPKNMVCLPSRAVPVVLMNGTSDPIVPYGGGTEHNMNLPTLSAEDSAKAWAKINRCSEKPEKSKLPGHGKGAMEVKVNTYNGCQSGAQVVLYSVKGGGNTWPGGEQYEPEKTVGKTDADLNADETLWSFLVSRRLPETNRQ